MKNKVQSFIVGGFLTACVLFPIIGYADDTEIYFAQANVENPDNIPAANVLFLIDTSGSMCDYTTRRGTNRDCGNPNTPMAGLRTSFSKMIKEVSDSVRVGLAKFNGDYNHNHNYGYGGYVFYPVSELNDDVRDELIGLVNRLQGTSNTPTMEAYSEAARYMLGLDVTGYAKTGEAIQNSPRLAVNIYAKDGRLYTHDKYDSPINMKNQCETNHIIVMTDGAPTADTDYKSVSNIVGRDGCTTDQDSMRGSTSEKKSFACQKTLAAFLQTDSPHGQKPIKTWQIAFGVGATSNEVKNMQQVAEAGGTENVYYADNSEELAKAFIDILDLIDGESKSISAPGIAVNTSNRFQHLDELYYALFQPAESSYWEGNLKRYRLGNNKIVGKDGNPAIDSATGYFSPEAISYWSTVKDGADVMKGGARGQLPVKPRTLFYSTKAGEILKLNWSSSQLRTILGASNDAELAEMVKQLQTMWGDAMHGVPLMVNYGKKDNDEDENYVFVSNNGGMLHIIDTKDGKEVAAFMPHEMFKNVKKFTIERPSLRFDNTRQIYGLDGSWVAWRKTKKTAKPSDKPEAVYIYGGMRRGGKHYYALDVTDPAQPKVKWKIGPDTPGFQQLGETWSTPTLLKVKHAGKEVAALVFGGGYSPEDHDPHDGQGKFLGAREKTTRDRQGNAVYIVNAETGELIWRASHQKMQWAIPGGIAVVDRNLDGFADYLYFGDLGGQLFRVNLDQKDQSKNTVTRIAALGGTGADNRRFYEAPAVGLVKTDTGNALYVAAASGYREHPLEQATKDGLFVVSDNPLSDDESVVTLAKMQNVINSKGQKPSHGWYYFFQEEAKRFGEKAMSSPVIYDGKVLLSTYAPELDSKINLTNACSVSYGAAYLHAVDLYEGSAVSIEHETSTLPSSTRSRRLAFTTPPPSPSILLNEQGESQIVVGTNFVGKDKAQDQRLRKLRWKQLQKNEANQYFLKQ